MKIISIVCMLFVVGCVSDKANHNQIITRHNQKQTSSFAVETEPLTPEEDCMMNCKDRTPNDPPGVCKHNVEGKK